MVLPAAKRYPLRHACFAEFKVVAEGLYDLGASGVELELITGLQDQDVYYADVTRLIDVGRPGIFSASVGPNLWHMGIFLGYEGDVLEFLNPASGKIETSDRSTLGFSADILAARRIASASQASLT